MLDASKKLPLSREEQKLRTRQRILSTASSLFSRNGIGSTRTQDVAKAAGIAHGTVFVHFPTRDALVSAVIEGFAEKVINSMAQLSEHGTVRDILGAHIEGLKKNEELYFRLVTEGLTLPKSSRNVLLGIQSVISISLFDTAAKEMHNGTIRITPQHLLFNTCEELYGVAVRDYLALWLDDVKSAKMSSWKGFCAIP